ncbi:MAG: hypothetical protein ABRQ39_04265 [Candidatus Eremiobacterota bacterium]
MEVNIDESGEKHVYMECDSCGRLEYISPAKKALLDEAVKNMGK